MKRFKLPPRPIFDKGVEIIKDIVGMLLIIGFFAVVITRWIEHDQAQSKIAIERIQDEQARLAKEAGEPYISPADQVIIEMREMREKP